MTLKPLLRAFLLGFLLLGTVGCGGDSFYPVTGKVTFPDGKPLTIGRVNYDSEKHSAYGQIQEDGTYELTSIEEGDGAPAGTYKVYISGANEGSYTGGAHGEGMFVASGSLIAKEYASPDSTPITKEVGGSNEDFDIQVEPSKK